jgi:hypothetical protein
LPMIAESEVIAFNVYFFLSTFDSLIPSALEHGTFAQL